MRQLNHEAMPDLFVALVEANNLIDSFVDGEDMPRRYISGVQAQITAALTKAAGGPVDAAGERIDA